MIFVYELKGPGFEDYKPSHFESRNFISAINFLENLVPSTLFNSWKPHKDFPDHTVELWELEKPNAKEPSVRYQLVPQKNGCLACDALATQLWKDLHQNPDKIMDFPLYSSWEQCEEWLGNHHTKGMDYLRYGALGEAFGEQRLAEIGRSVLENMSNILEDKTKWEAIDIFNKLGLSFKDCDKANLLLDVKPCAVLYQSSMHPLSAGDEKTDKQNASSTWSTDPRQLLYTMQEDKEMFPHQNLYVDGKCIAQMVDGKFQEPANILSPEHLDTDMQDALSAVQAVLAGYDCTRSLTFLVTSSNEENFGETFADIQAFSAKKGVYNVDSALKAFRELGDIDGKRLSMIFEHNNIWVSHPVLGQYGGELCCEPTVHFQTSRRSEKIISDILSKAFPDKTFNIDHWTVKVIGPGEKYGRNNHLINDCGKPIVRFYDADHKGEYFDPEGQFTGGEYYLETLIGKDKFNGCQDASHGLVLSSEVPSWVISENMMQPVVQWLKVKDKEFEKERKPSLSAQMSAAEDKNKAQERKNEQKGNVYHERD